MNWYTSSILDVKLFSSTHEECTHAKAYTFDSVQWHSSY